MPDHVSTAAASVIAAMPHALWRANQMSTYRTPTIASGYAELDAELPNGGWPRSSVTELLLQQHGIGEMQLLGAALAPLSQSRRIAFIQPPHAPQGQACYAWGLRPDNVLWLRTKTSADALWTAEQILRTGGSCGAMVLWQSNIRPESLRRLNLAAQSTDTCLWIIRPISAKADTSPAALRLALRPAYGGVNIEIVKRRGPHSDEVLYLSLPGMPSTRHIEVDHALLDQRVSAAAAARSAAPVLV